jgi:hypothetical protein
MRWNTNFLGAVLLILACASSLLKLPSRLQTAAEPSCEGGGYCFVTSEGAGARNGVDWDNAYADLPRTLTRGVMYFVAGSEKSYADHVFDDPDRGTAQIFIYKAVDCAVVPSAPYCGTINPASVAGWQASFGTQPANWISTPDQDPEAYIASIWHFCTDYYTVDGVTGSTAPSTPGGQGFVIGAQNKMLEGMLAIGNNGCGGPSPAGLTNLVFSHLEVKGTGPMPYYQVPVTDCSYDGSNATITMASSLNGVVGDRMGGWTSADRIIFTNARSSSISSTQAVLPLNANPCSTLAYVDLDFLPPIGFEAVNHANLNETVSNLTIQYCYVHDTGESFLAYNGYNVALLHNYFARNRSTITEHGSIVQFDEGASSTVSGPVTVAYNFVVDPTGTATFTHLGLPARCASNCGTLDGYYVYGNIVTCSPSALPYQCFSGHGTIDDNSGFTVTRNSRFYDNTLIGVDVSGVSLFNLNSIGGVAEDNLFFASRTVYMNGVIHDYNTLVDSRIAYGATCETHEICIPSDAANPFINDAGFDFHLAADTDASAKSRNPVAGGKFLPSPYNIDFDGKTRGASGTWARGAYEFNNGPQRPANLKTTVR